MAVGMHCMSQDGFLTDTRRWVDDQRERLRTRLGEYVRVYPSDAPFLLLDLRSADRVDTLLDSARKHGIAIRDARTFRHLDAHVRVTVRNRTANDHLLELFAEAL
jgi:histidinol-phosphate/aromatic aminotransferase/cobyric acid decarboxylase-like protein